MQYKQSSTGPGGSGTATLSVENLKPEDPTYQIPIPVQPSGSSSGTPHLSRAPTLLNEPPPLMDQKDAAGGLALWHGQGALDGPAIGELRLDLL